MGDYEYLELEWPSRRIPPGGVFHHVKTSYSPDVQNMMKVLMDESKLTLSQRRHVDWCLRTGSSLNDIKHSAPKSRKTSATIIPNKQPVISRRRSLTAIKNSGDFERERYNPNYRIEDREIIKKRLQDIMEFGKIQNKMSKLQINTNKPKQLQTVLPNREDMFNNLLTQIRERMEWLQEMETLGEGFKHRDVIHHEISERIKEIEKYKVYSEKDLQNSKLIQNKNHKSKESALKVSENEKSTKNEKNINIQTFFNIKKSKLNF